ncbi:hypothetical protein ABW19_dt0208181 [Dactylella cylindrospora]|nr:hypothetical protein ABW19_dt0208181 [Dactylella cylindrospora]
MCGSGDEYAEVLRNVILVTTRWESQPAHEMHVAEKREKQLISAPEFWGRMAREGARFERHNNTRESALRILKNFVPDAPETLATQITLAIQHEMAEQNLQLDETAAGQVLTKKIRELRDSYQKELENWRRDWEAELRRRDQRIKELELYQAGEEELKTKIQQLEDENSQLRRSGQSPPTRFTRRLEYDRQRREHNLDANEKVTNWVIEDREDNQGGSQVDSSFSTEISQEVYHAGEPSNVVRMDHPGPVDSSASSPEVEGPEEHPLQGLEGLNIQSSVPPARPYEPQPGMLIRGTRIRHLTALDDSLGSACAAGNLEEVQGLLKEYTEAELAGLRFSGGKTLLHLAAASGKATMLDILLPRLKDHCLLVPDLTMRRPIHWAVTSNDLGTVRALLDYMTAEEVCKLDGFGSSPLVLAMLGQNVSIFRDISCFHQPGLPIISNGALVDMITKQPKEMLKLFLDTYKSDPEFWNISEQTGNKILHLAVMAPPENCGLVFRALRSAAPVEQKKQIFALNIFGMTALGLAACLGMLEIIELFLMTFGSHFPIKDIVNSQSPVGSAYFLALIRGHKECAKRLVECGADISRVEVCGLSSKDWMQSVSGLVIKKRFRILKSVGFVPLADAAEDKRTQQRRRLLSETDKALAADPIKLLLLSRHYFILAAKDAIMKGKNAQERDKVFGINIGITLYAFYAHIMIQKLNWLACNGCPEVTKSRFYTCISCLMADYCEDCNGTRTSGGRLPDPIAHCPPHHVWVFIDLDDFNFRQKGYISDYQTVSEFFGWLREMEHVGRPLNNPNPF